jgi:hypothetical protein
MLLVAFFVGPRPATAAFQLTMSNAFSGPGTPSAFPVVTITQDGAGAVFLEMDISSLLSSEKVSQWYFNFAPGFPPALAFQAISGQTAGVTISQANNGFKADGDGRYDILFDFAAGGADAFTGGETSKWRVTVVGGGNISEQDFNDYSAPAGGHGPFISALHLQGTSTGSVWLSEGEDPNLIPAPPSVILAGIGGIFFGVRQLRNRRKKASA